MLVTGGAGFIGSALIRRAFATTDHEILNIDKLTYASDLASLDSIADDPRYRFLRLDICDGRALAEAFAAFRPETVLHLAAESHVDRSIDSPAAFINTNVIGTYTLLEVARAYWAGLSGDERNIFRFVHVSTDEVFGSLGPADPAFDERSPYAPRSPYSSSKAASDHLVRAWRHTYGLPAIVSNCSNNFGPYQFPEKLIPLMTIKALRFEPLPVYGDGSNVRDWLHVDDHAAALIAVAEKGAPGASYLFGGGGEYSNLQVVEKICDILDDLAPEAGRSRRDLIRFVEDRPGHDFRYAIDAGKAERELGWTRSGAFGEQLAATIRWYVDNEDWWRAVQRRSGYAGNRLGVTPPPEA